MSVTLGAFKSDENLINAEHTMSEDDIDIPAASIIGTESSGDSEFMDIDDDASNQDDPDYIDKLQDESENDEEEEMGDVQPQVTSLTVSRTNPDSILKDACQTCQKSKRKSKNGTS
jgi:hypothetical protein